MPAPHSNRYLSLARVTPGLLALAVALAPASLAAPSRSMRFQHLAREQGLSQSTVTCMLQDRAGFLWLGTQDGLNRYDGYRFAVYKHDSEDPTTLQSDWIQALAQDPSGDLWVGTEGGGLSRWRRRDDSFLHFRHDGGDPASLSGDRVRSLHVDGRGMLWVGTFDSGLNRLRGDGTFDRFRHNPADPASLAGDRVRAIHEDRAGNLWVGTESGLSRYDHSSGNFVSYRHDSADVASLSSDDVLSLAEDHTGTLWVGTSGGLNRLVRATRTFVRYRHDPAAADSLSHDNVRALLADRSRRLWVGTDDGLNLLGADGGFVRYRHDDATAESLADDRVMSLAEDRTGVLWVGTHSFGADRWNPVTWSFSHYRADRSTPDGLSSSRVYAFSEDAAGRLWIGTLGGGLNVFERTTGAPQTQAPQADRFIHYRHDSEDPESLSDDRVSALLHDRRGALWVGTMGSGLSHLGPGSDAGPRQSFRHYRPDPKRPGALGHGVVSALHEDVHGRIWAGTFGGGAQRFEAETDTFVGFRHDPDDPHSLSNDRAISFAEDPGRFLWVGTYGGGLNRFSPESETFARYVHVPGRSSTLSNDTVMSLHVDAGGTLWAGTEEGLNKLVALDDTSSQAVFKRYDERQGLANETVYGIQPDTEGRLWLSTNYGLSRFDPHSESCENYDAGHGLQSNEFNFGAHHRSPSGELFFGGVNGFNAFFPDRIEHNTAVPPVVLTGFTKLNQPVDFGRPVFDVDQLALSYRDEFFSFEFAALDYAAPEKNHYRYQLVGFNDNWVDIGNRRQVTFTNLDPGSYRLRVQGSNDEGLWNDKGISLPITIAPPYWQAWWFRLLVASAAAAAAWLVYLLRTRSIRKTNERLQALVTERTDELEEAHAELVRQEKLATLGELAGGVAHEIRTPLGLIKNVLFLLRRQRPLDDEESQQRFRLIDRQLDHANRIVSELLDYAQAPSARYQRFALQDAAEEALEKVDVPAAIRLESRFEAVPLLVDADPEHIRRILINLLDNAVQAMPKGGTLRLEGGRFGDEMGLAVLDTGSGIDEEHLSRVFEPLFTTKANGIGLGLPVAQRYARMNRGRIEYDSLPGKGAIFRLVLPEAGDPKELNDAG